MTKQNQSPSFLRDGQNFVTNNEEKADLLNTYFQSEFSSNDGTSESYQGPSATPALFVNHLSEICLTKLEVTKVLENIDVNKAPAPDNIPARLLKETAAEIASSTCRLFHLLLFHGKFPDQWKQGNVCPVYKNEDPTLTKNYRPILLLHSVQVPRTMYLQPLLYPHIVTALPPAT